jgi:hypothetical protein
VRLLTLRGIVPASLQDAAEDGIEIVLEDLAGGGASGDEAGSRSVAELAAGIAELGTPDGLRATFSSRGRGPLVLRRRGLLLRGKVRLPVRVLRRR